MARTAKKEVTPAAERGLRRWNDPADSPFDILLRGRDGLHRQLDRLFDDFWDNGRMSGLLGSWSGAELSPRVDETEDEKAYHIEVELPGMDQSDVDVSYSDGLLTISGEKKQEKEEKDKDYYRKERSFGSFRRVLPIPVAVDEAKIQASFKKGVLSIELPKSREAQKKVKKITVKSAQ
jgi:HSP20 family protein